jgi:hypothetical protein
VVLAAAVRAVKKMAALLRQLLERLIQVVAAVAVELPMVRTQWLVLLAAPALSSCPTPCQKAQPFNSCLLRHGKHQQASLPLTTWWLAVAAVAALT